MSKVNWPPDLGSDLANLAARVRSLESSGRATQTVVDVGQLSGNVTASSIDPSAWASESWSVTAAGLTAPLASSTIDDTYGSASQQITWSDGTTAAPAAYLERRADGTLILYNGTDPAATIKLSSINAIVTGNLEVVGSLLVDNALYAATPALRYETRSTVSIPTSTLLPLATDYLQSAGNNPADGTGLTLVSRSGVNAIQVGRRGIYRISVSVGFPVNSSGTRAVWLTLDGSRRIVENEVQANANGPTVCTANADIGFNVGDVIVPWCFQNAGTALNVGGSTTNSYPGFSVVYVCDATVGTYTSPPPPPPPPTPPPPTHGTYRSTAYGSRSWSGTWGWHMDDENARQGDGSTWGGGDEQRGFYFHNGAAIAAALAGKTPTGGRVWVYRQRGAGYDAPATIGVWTHHIVWYGAEADIDSESVSGQTLGWDQGAWINIPVWMCNELATGTKSGIALKHPGADAYGVFDSFGFNALNGAIEIDW